MDGVGDYTRILATELIALGHECSLVAIADHHVNKPATCDFGDANYPLPALRLPARASWPERLRAAIAYRQDFAPEWVSWQIVLYGFDRRGLSFGLGRRLREVSLGCKNQIMFHELWIGEAIDTSFKNKLMGKAQKLIISDLLKKLRPRVVHTHTPFYRHLLGRLGYHVTLLPLFGNIPLTTQPWPDWLQEKWPEGGLFSNARERKSWWIFVMFGTIHPEWDAENFWRQAQDACQRSNKKCLLISIGRPGGIGERSLRALQLHEGSSWRVLNLGQQSPEAISQCLLTADFGVSAAPPEYVFKSGTVAAMVEHGLPVLVTRPAGSYADCPPEILLLGLKNVERHFEVRSLKKSEPQSLLPAVAAQFIEDLQQP
jgi:glycosyltransferase involved in cell wall biosynthesis